MEKASACRKLTPCALLQADKLNNLTAIVHQNEIALMFFAVLAHDTPELLRPPRRLQVCELNAVTEHVQDFVHKLWGPRSTGRVEGAPRKHPGFCPHSRKKNILQMVIIRWSSWSRCSLDQEHDDEKKNPSLSLSLPLALRASVRVR